MKTEQRAARAATTETPAGRSVGNSLVWGVAQGVTGVLQLGRGALSRTVEEVTTGVHQLVGALRDTGSDLLTYVEPGAWLEDMYTLLGIASSGAVGEIDERMDSVELRLDDVARQRAREELLVLRQRVGELEALLAEVRRGETFAAIETLIDRLSELEARVESLPGAPI